MSVKDVKEYYNQVCDQYHDMLNEIRDFEEEAKKGLIEPERLDQIKETITPLMNNYQTLSYIMFLLNKPVRKSKYKRYEERNKKFLQSIEEKNSKKGVLDTNNQTIDRLKKII